MSQVRQITVQKKTFPILLFQVNISTFNSYLRVFIVVFMFIIYINNNHVSANGIYDQTSLEKNDDDLVYSPNTDELFHLDNFKPENSEFTRRGVWSRLFRGETDQPRVHSRSHHSLTEKEPGYDIQTGRIRLIPFDKRAIPIELQKALYAHGIVGRRR